MVTKTPHRRIIRLPEVQSRSGLSRASIYRGAIAGWFPKPIKLTKRASGWFEDEVQAYLDQRAAVRDGTASETRE